MMAVSLEYSWRRRVVNPHFYNQLVKFLLSEWFNVRIPMEQDQGLDDIDQSLPKIEKVWSISAVNATPKKPAFQCDFCNEEFRTIQSMKAHLRGHAHKHKENRPPYFCQACSKSYLENDKLLEHIKHHYRSLKSDHEESFKMDSSPSPPKLSRFGCRICSNTYSSKQTLKKHEEKAHSSKVKIKSYECDLCGETVPKYQRSSHLRTVHPTYLNCDICDVRFVSKRHLNNHKRNKHQKAVYGCRFCLQTFTSTDHLKFHEMRHSKEESLYDRLIENIKMKISDDKQHSKFTPPSTPSKPSKTLRFICRICSNTYACKYARNKHETKAHYKQQVEVNTYKCDLCGERVPQSQKIWHLRAIHPTHIERNKCDICHLSFSDRNALNTHKRNQHQSYLYVCRFCPKTFAYVDHLRYHEMRHANEEKQH